MVNYSLDMLRLGISNLPTILQMQGTMARTCTDSVRRPSSVYARREESGAYQSYYYQDIIPLPCNGPVSATYSSRQECGFGSPRSRLEPGASRRDVKQQRWQQERWGLSLIQVSCLLDRRTDWSQASGGLPAEFRAFWARRTWLAWWKMLRSRWQGQGVTWCCRR